MKSIHGLTLFAGLLLSTTGNAVESVDLGKKDEDTTAVVSEIVVSKVDGTAFFNVRSLSHKKKVCNTNSTWDFMVDLERQDARLVLATLLTSRTEQKVIRIITDDDCNSTHDLSVITSVEID